MQSKTGFPSSHQLKSYVAPKSRLKFAARCPVSSCWPSCCFRKQVVMTWKRLKIETWFQRRTDRKSYVAYRVAL